MRNRNRPQKDVNYARSKKEIQTVRWPGLSLAQVTLSAPNQRENK